MEAGPIRGIGELAGEKPLTLLQRKHNWQIRWLQMQQFLEQSREAHHVVRRAEKSHRMTMRQLAPPPAEPEPISPTITRSRPDPSLPESLTQLRARSSLPLL